MGIKFMYAKHKPAINDYVKADGWSYGTHLQPGDAPVDDSYLGCQFRVELCNTRETIPINIKVTGMPKYYRPTADYRARIQIEFVKDGEPSDFTGGYIYYPQIDFAEEV